MQVHVHSCARAHTQAMLLTDGVFELIDIISDIYALLHMRQLRLLCGSAYQGLWVSFRLVMFPAAASSLISLYAFCRLRLIYIHFGAPHVCVCKHAKVPPCSHIHIRFYRIRLLRRKIEERNRAKSSKTDFSKLLRSKLGNEQRCSFTQLVVMRKLVEVGSAVPCSMLYEACSVRWCFCAMCCSVLYMVCCTCDMAMVCHTTRSIFYGHVGCNLTGCGDLMQDGRKLLERQSVGTIDRQRMYMRSRIAAFMKCTCLRPAS